MLTRPGELALAGLCRQRPTGIYRAKIMAELPRWSLRNAEQLKKSRLIRIDLRRSIKMHRWLALGVALAGAALAGVYVLVFWPNAAEQTHITSLILDAGLIVLAGVVLGAAA